MLETAVVALAVALAAPAGGEPTRTFAVDPAASRIRIHLGRSGLMKFLGHDHEIDAPVAEGGVEVAAGAASQSSVRLRFAAARLAVVPGTEPADDVPKVEERMRGPEVLDVDRYPLVAFSSSSVAETSSDHGRRRLLVRGTLEIKGRSVPVEVPLEVRYAEDVLEASGEVELQLRTLGIEPPSVAGVVKVADRFRLAFTITARLAARSAGASRP
jgi:polyisoprenoid-binding protein YceI